MPVKEAREQQRFLMGAVLLAISLAAWVNPGNLGNIDAVRRLRLAHSWWAGTPEVGPADIPNFGSVGRGGVLRTVYGVGHSFVLLPADMLVTPVVEKLNLPAAGREAAIAFLTQAFIASMLVLAAYHLLVQLGFDHGQSALGTLSLLLGTTALHYIQNAQENLLMTTLAMGGTACLLKWRSDGDARALIWAGAMFGYSLLIRLTTLADLGAAALMMLLLDRGRVLRAVPRFSAALGGFVLLERCIQFWRFGNWTATYYSGMLAAAVTASGSNRLYRHPFWKGLWAALGSPSDSIFLFDPLLTLAVVLLAISWKRLSAEVKCYAIGALASLTVYLLFYATYESPTGETSWGDRYVTTPVLLLALLGVPLVLKLFSRMPIWAWVVVAWSVLLQLASLPVIMSIEVYQAFYCELEDSISMRLLNIWLVWTGESTNSPLFMSTPQEWRTWNFLPFQMRLRYPELARWAVAMWWALGAMWAAQVGLLLRGIQRVRSGTNPL
jgi:hypothetical protein